MFSDINTNNISVDGAAISRPVHIPDVLAAGGAV